MSHRGHLAAAVTILGASLGGLCLWRVFRTSRRRPPSIQKVVDPVEAPPAAETSIDSENRAPRRLEKEPKAEGCRDTQPLPVVHIPSSEELLQVKPVVVSSEEEWQRLWPLMQEELSVFPVLGLDCEWVSVNGRASAVSLLQMASYSGLCVLVKLLSFRREQQPLPPSLLDVLRDPHVLKVGVGCYDDRKRLARDYGLSLTCTVDLRSLALRQSQGTATNGISLKSLAADLLDICLDKSLPLRCSDWEADELTLEQMTYAARDAQVSVALFLNLLGFRAKAGPASSSGSSYAELAARCQGLVDVPFRDRADGKRKTKTKKLLDCESPESGDQQIPDPRKNKRKPLGVGYSARKSPLYDNCFLHAPDGQPLCTCDKKKARWYLDKGIGVLQSEKPFIVRLLFEPSGRPDSQQDYYLTAKENLCVVCGKVDSYIRKNIVPHEYRRHFPTEMKDHNSHDVLLLCTSCHAASNVHDGFLKTQLAEEFAAPQGGEDADGVRLLEDVDRRRVRSAARALLMNSEALPEPRRDELQVLIKSFLNVDEEEELTKEALQQAANLEIRIFNEVYVSHGLKVVQAHAQLGLRGLMDLERRWRQHFLSTMQPKHLPPLWSVDHNHSKFLRKYGEDLPIKLK